MIAGAVSDGLRAVEKAQELQPDLICLDIGLPRVNGIEASRRIGEARSEVENLVHQRKPLLDIVEEALRTGALGYVVKSDAATTLLPAAYAVLRGSQFLSAPVSLAPGRAKSEYVTRV